MKSNNYQSLYIEEKRNNNDQIKDEENYNKIENNNKKLFPKNNTYLKFNNYVNFDSSDLVSKSPSKNKNELKKHSNIISLKNNSLGEEYKYKTEINNNKKENEKDMKEDINYLKEKENEKLNDIIKKKEKENKDILNKKNRNRIKKSKKCK